MAEGGGVGGPGLDTGALFRLIANEANAAINKPSDAEATAINAREWAKIADAKYKRDLKREGPGGPTSKLTPREVTNKYWSIQKQIALIKAPVEWIRGERSDAFLDTRISSAEAQKQMTRLMVNMFPEAMLALFKIGGQLADNYRRVDPEIASELEENPGKWIPYLQSPEEKLRLAQLNREQDRVGLDAAVQSQNSKIDAAQQQADAAEQAAQDAAANGDPDAAFKAKLAAQAAARLARELEIGRIHQGKLDTFDGQPPLTVDDFPQQTFDPRGVLTGGSPTTTPTTNPDGSPSDNTPPGGVGGIFDPTSPGLPGQNNTGQTPTSGPKLSDIISAAGDITKLAGAVGAGTSDFGKGVGSVSGSIPPNTDPSAPLVDNLFGLPVSVTKGGSFIDPKGGTQGFADPLPFDRIGQFAEPFPITQTELQGFDLLQLSPQMLSQILPAILGGIGTLEDVSQTGVDFDAIQAAANSNFRDLREDTAERFAGTAGTFSTGFSEQSAEQNRRLNEVLAAQRAELGIQNRQLQTNAALGIGSLGTVGASLPSSVASDLLGLGGGLRREAERVSPGGRAFEMFQALRQPGAGFVQQSFDPQGSNTAQNLSASSDILSILGGVGSALGGIFGTNTGGQQQPGGQQPGSPFLFSNF